jgi:hemolysin activation/secretion protein
LSAQWSNSNLDSAEKMVAGGAYTVRAYDMGAVSGDSGVLGNVELRQSMGDLGGFGQWQAVAFVDSEHVTVNQITWVTGVNGANLTGTGVGLNWSNNSGWHAKIYAATPVGSVPVLITDGKKTHGWAEIGAWF